ncbi:hypothetical protein B296_00000036 [Ensete ventricosum]|uniref:Uncharacterized protein n=1 Tax=Ensete ventricosum TaxID=4639 RepID=A0A427AWS4_ENSVE|nr:hypothetical protein B296_00000036 [Ensete ventricosum]
MRPLLAGDRHSTTMLPQPAYCSRAVAVQDCRLRAAVTSSTQSLPLCSNITDVAILHESYRPLQPSLSPKQITPNLSPLKPVAEVVAAVLPELRENLEQGRCSSTRKKVTFDLNVTTYEEASVDNDPNYSSEVDEETEAIDEGRKPNDGQDKSSPMSGGFPLNHRYQNCENSDDDDGHDEEEDYGDSDFGEEEEDNEVVIERNEEESYDSFFSLPIDKEPPECLQEVNSPNPKSASSPDRQPILVSGGSTRDRSQFVHPVLNPVENLSQWKVVKAGSMPVKNPKKEKVVGTEQENNVAFISESVIKAKKPQAPNRYAKQEISVDASFSTWLPSSENSTAEGPQASNSHRSNSSFSREERPILDALTMEDIKQSSVTSSPVKRSPSRSLDEITILGTVGGYWNCKNHGDDSACSRKSVLFWLLQDKTVNWHSTPFEVRLERALKNGAA